MSNTFSRPSPIRTDASNAFANHTMRVRVPKIIRDVQAWNPDYPAPIQRALDHLHDTIEEGAVIPMLSLPAPNDEDWADAHARHAGDTWDSTGWFYAEVFVYAHLMQAVRWWETGRDPFAPRKAEEIASLALWQTLEQALETRSMEREERLAALLIHALWGNRIDLSYAAALAHGGTWIDSDLLVGDQAKAAEFLLRHGGVIHIIHDNTGTELAMDLALADGLLDGVAEQVILHLKFHPTYVSDATLGDLLQLLDIFESGARGDDARQMSRRLQNAFIAGRLRLAPDLFWNSSHFLWELPPRLDRLFRDASLVIVKGDANYRRTVGDAIWQPDTPLQAAVNGFPAPLLLLRTLKSYPVVGLPTGMAETLDPIDADWRVNGRRGVIQTSWT